jgi:putative transposase
VSYWRFYYHLVWSTKSRLPLIDEVADRAIRDSLMLTSEEMALIPHAIGLMPDHVHFAVTIPPKLAVSEVVRRLKGGSSHAVNVARGMPNERFAWQPEYGALTLGEKSMPRLIEYVRNQRKHHSDHALWPEMELTNER